MNWWLQKYYFIRYAMKKDPYIPLRHQSIFANRKPIQPVAFIRAFNEITTIEASLNSILPAIQRGVIAYHASDTPSDGTVEFIHDFCHRHSGFVPFYYPHPVIPANDIRYQASVAEENRLDTYYNAALAQIPQNTWLIKIDMDQIYDADKLRQSFRLPMRDTDCVLYGKINLHYIDQQIMIHKHYPLTEYGDHWLIKNNNLKFLFDSGIDSDTGKFYAWEYLPIQHYRHIKTELVTWHFPAMKAWRQNNPDFIQDQWQSFAEWKNNGRPTKCYKNRLAEDMLTDERILSIIRQFKL